MIRLLVHTLRSLSRQKVVSFSQSSCALPVVLTVGRRGRGWARSQIIRPRESLALHKSFNVLWARFSVPFCPDHRVGRVLSLSSIRRNWDSPNPSPPGESALSPLWFWGRGDGHTRWRERVGKSRFRRRDILCGTLYIYVLCGPDALMSPLLSIGRTL
jgi:hypothetical protein